MYFDDYVNIMSVYFFSMCYYYYSYILLNYFIINDINRLEKIMAVIFQTDAIDLKIMYFKFPFVNYFKRMHMRINL